MFPFHLLLAFQLENYDMIRFLRFIYLHPRFRRQGSQRQTLDWTLKVKLLFVGAWLLTIGMIGVSFFYLQNALLTVGVFFLLLLLQPVVICLIVMCMFPLDRRMKRRVIMQAKNKLAKFPKLKVIGITGSRGKTSQKEFLNTILSQQYKVLATEGNKNTPMGIGRLILEKLDEAYDLLLVEMGAYGPGDIEEMCDIVHPTIGILTTIGEQHLERFGSIDKIIQTKFELLMSLPADGQGFVVESENGNVKKGMNSFEQILQASILPITPLSQLERSYKDNFTGLCFSWQGQSYETSLVAKHNVPYLITAIEVAKKVGITQKNIAHGLDCIIPVDHRLSVMRNPHNNTIILDDTYNGNIAGFLSTLDALTYRKKQKKPGRIVYVTPGILELGQKTEETHTMLAQQLTPLADVVLCIATPAGKMLYKALKQGSFPSDNLLLFAKSEDAHVALKGIIKAGDVIVFQNDATDNYM